MFSHFFCDFPEADEKQNRGGRGREHICNRLGKKDREQLVLEEAGQNENERYQQENLAFQREEQRDFRFTERHERLLKSSLKGVRNPSAM